METQEKSLQRGKDIDMLRGTLADKLLLVALPLAVSSILQQLFNSVDVAVVGKFVSSRAQAAVGCNGPVINLLLNLFVGISVGANVVIASAIGQKQQEKVRAAVHTSMVIAGISGIFLLFLGILIARPVLVWMDTPSDVLDQAVLYLQIYFLGMPFIMLYNFGAAILRSVGDTRRPLFCLILSGVVNALLNLFLVIVIHMGVEGVAIATVISNVISCSMVLYFLMHEQSMIHLSLRELRIAKTELVQMLRIGIPAGLQSTVFSVANVCIQTALNSYGSDAVAGSAVTLNYEYYAYFMISAFAQTVVTFISQNYGAGEKERCKKIYRLSMLITILIVGVMSITFVLGRDFFIGLFTSEPRVAEYAAIRMVYLLTVYIMIVPYEIGGAALRGMGYSMTPAVLTIFGTCVLRLLWVYTVCRKIRDYGLLVMIYPITWAVTGILVTGAYIIITRKILRRTEQ